MVTWKPDDGFAIFMLPFFDDDRNFTMEYLKIEDPERFTFLLNVKKRINPSDLKQRKVYSDVVSTKMSRLVS